MGKGIEYAVWIPAADSIVSSKHNDDVHMAIGLLKRSAPSSLTFTPEELDAYSDRLVNIIDEYQV